MQALVVLGLITLVLFGLYFWAAVYSYRQLCRSYVLRHLSRLTLARVATWWAKYLSYRAIRPSLEYDAAELLATRIADELRREIPDPPDPTAGALRFHCGESPNPYEECHQAEAELQALYERDKREARRRQPRRQSKKRTRR